MTRERIQDIANSRDEEAALWCMRISEGVLDADERLEFNTWLVKPPNARLFQEAAAIWQLSGTAASQPELAEALREERPGPDATRRSWFAGSAHWWGIAAAICLMIGASLVWLNTRQLEFETGIGERHVAVLKDGSRFTLDADTVVKARYNGDSRQVTLVRGRAKFDVAKDPLRPFTVAAGGKLVVATGTSFSVELVGGQLHVLLYEGRLEIRNRDDRPGAGSEALGPRQAMASGRELVVQEGTPGVGTIRPADLSQTLDWEQGQLNFEEEPLAVAAARMNRYSPVKLTLADPNIGKTKISGVFAAGDVSALAEGVTALYPLHEVRRNNEILLVKN